LVYVFLQRIIHKPVARNARLAFKHHALNPNPKVGALADVVGPNVACMGGAFIHDFEK
jgi:hypothetical protein